MPHTVLQVVTTTTTTTTSTTIAAAVWVSVPKNLVGAFWLCLPCGCVSSTLYRFLRTVLFHARGGCWWRPLRHVPLGHAYLRHVARPLFFAGLFQSHTSLCRWRVGGLFHSVRVVSFAWLLPAHACTGHEDAFYNNTCIINAKAPSYARYVAIHVNTSAALPFPRIPVPL